MSDTEPSPVRQRHLIETNEDAEDSDSPVMMNDNSRKRDKPLGSRSKWSVSSGIEKLLWLLVVPLRALLCVSNVTVFFITYFGFMITVLWARKLWPRFYWFYGKGQIVSLAARLHRYVHHDAAAVSHGLLLAFWGYTADYDVYEYGDDITSYGDSDRVLVMVNHQSTADVPTLFTALQHKGVAARKTLWLMDVMFRWTPFGVIGRMHGDYFIQQGKATRDRELERLHRHLQKVFWDRDRRWVILFPEGGFFYKRYESSQRYAKQNGFPELKYTTLPRMGAVKVVLETLGPRKEDDEEEDLSIHKSKSGNRLKILTDTVGALRDKRYVKESRPPIKYVLDVTIAYPNGHPLSLGTLIFGSRENCEIAVNYKIHKATDVPFHDETKLRDWMYDVYVNKDRLLANYYKFGTFTPGERGTRVVFPWSRIIGQYAFWLGSFILQMKILSQLYYFMCPPRA